ncbi:hypothetical protein Tcan_18388 [Toxocara canis]|uniref:Uncharacterized protein n=1 Tax=Toxocara canis TaxID=6265 RepID=A0A0B2UT49_TOXCA|nr:hypothetical protein Tcan_18388 [Toxocara canis]
MRALAAPTTSNATLDKERKNLSTEAGLVPLRADNGMNVWSIRHVERCERSNQESSKKPAEDPVTHDRSPF